MKPKLIYVYDPLCGWCYGFSPVMEALVHTYDGRVQIEVMSGGLAVGERAMPVAQGYGYIRNALGIVEKTTGVQFGEAFRTLIDEGTYIYDSMPPCIALTVFKEHLPGRALEFAHDLHRALFVDGLNLNDTTVYRSLVAPYDLDAAGFVQKMEDPAYRRKTLEEFETVAAMGVTGFPTLVYLDDEHGVALARGYRRYEPIATAIDKALQAAV